MRDPERLTSSNGLSDLERELLEAGKNETMPAALREQMELALGFSGAAPGGGHVRARVEAATGVKASAIVWISAGVVVLGVVGGLIGSLAGARLGPGPAQVVTPAVAPARIEPPATLPGAPASSAGASRAVAPLPAPAGLEVAPGAGASLAPVAPPARRAGALAAASMRAHSHSRSHAAVSRGGSARPAGTGRGHAASASASAARPVAPGESVSGAVDAPPDAPIAEAPPHAASAGEQQKPSVNKSAPARAAAAPSSDLRAEIDLIDGARTALRAGDPAAAMDLLGKHAVHFPHGALAPEETALRVEALMRMGRTAEARAYARRFVAANPASPLAERIQRLVNGDTAP